MEEEAWWHAGSVRAARGWGRLVRRVVRAVRTVLVKGWRTAGRRAQLDEASSTALGINLPEPLCFHPLYTQTDTFSPGFVT